MRTVLFSVWTILPPSEDERGLRCARGPISQSLLLLALTLSLTRPPDAATTRTQTLTLAAGVLEPAPTPESAAAAGVLEPAPAPELSSRTPDDWSLSSDLTMVFH